MVQQLPEKDLNNYTRKQMLAMMDVCMGGRVAEELIYGKEEVSTGASSDLRKATDIARAMVTQYGFSDRVGLISGMEELSSETKSMIEDEVKKLLSEAYARASSLLKTHEKDLHKLASTLVERETLTGKEIQ